MKFHVRLLTGFDERRIEIADAMMAKDETEEASADWDAVVACDPVLRATSVALALEPRIAAGTGSSPSLATLVSESLSPVIEAGDPEALLILFQAFYRLGAYDDFMSHFCGLWSEQLRDPRFMDLIGLGYQVAVMIDHPLADELRIAIDALGVKEVQTNAEETAQRHATARRLSPMGRESYRLALRAMDASIGQDMLWRDAGLLALGFFRILEVELDERFVRPVANGIALDQFDAVVAAAPPDAKKPWKSALEHLRSVLSDSSERLMLGSLRKMCDEFAHPPPHIDAGLRAFVQGAFEAQLTRVGRAAFYSQDLIDTISSSRVGSYRNPPAHGRFVGIEEAKTCKQLVNESLSRYFSWFVSYY
jgi:hypothetical protein